MTAYIHAADAVGGDLQGTLMGWRDEGLSLLRCRDRLRDDYGISVSIETIRRWLSPPDREGS